MIARFASEGENRARLLENSTPAGAAVASRSLVGRNGSDQRGRILEQRPTILSHPALSLADKAHGAQS